ncbi:MAG TPA: hypothetical protein DER17_05370 [Oscillibacter sp.]|nr:hypothetical protein [Oscillibacter sp.]
MKQMGAASRKKLNIALLILLLVALVVLAAVLFVRAKPDAVSPDNRIETAEPLSLTLSRTALSAIFDDAASPQTGGYSAVPLTATVEFKGNHAAMTASGMLPGDSEEKTFTVTVKHRKTATVHFEAKLANDSVIDDTTGRKLSDGMNIKVVQGTDTLYNGSIAGLTTATPRPAVDVEVPGSRTTDLPYTITVSLPTSAGNEFQNKTLTIDLKWWLVSDEGGGGGGTITVDSSKTGDDFSLPLMGGAALVSLSLLAVLLLRRRKGENHD